MAIIHQLLKVELVMGAGKKVSTVSKIIILQAIVMVVATFAVFYFFGTQKALSSGLGGLVAFLPNLYFAYLVQLANGKDAEKIMRSFYVGEAKKVLLTAALFVLVFQIPEMNLLLLLMGYMAVTSVYWFALVLWRN
jgi:ATP synthase protein I